MLNHKIYARIINQNGFIVDLVNFIVEAHNKLINDSTFKEKKSCIVSDDSGIVIEFIYVGDEVRDNG